MLPQLVQHPFNGLYILFDFAFSIDENVIEVYYYENVKLFCQDLVDIALERSRYVSQSEKYHLVLKIAMVGLEDRFPFVSFPNPHLMVSIGQIKLGEILSPT